MFKRIRIIPFLSVIIFIVVGIIVIYDVFPTLSRAEKFAGIIIPSQASNVHYSFSTWLDASAKFRFDIATTDIQIFTDQLDKFCFTDELSSEDNPFSIDYDWWTPSQAEIFLGSQCHTEGYRYFSVLIDKTNPTTYVVYFSAS